MKAVVLLSGGMDSTTALAQAIQRHGAAHVTPLCIEYGAKHGPHERYRAQHIAWRLGTECVLRDCRKAFRGVRSSLLNGQAGEMSGAPTVVPGRNRVLIETAAGLAGELGAGEVVFAPHRGDAAVYEDCRPEFVEAMGGELDARGLFLRAPFLGLEKADIVAIGSVLGVPWELTWSCYAPAVGGLHCGACGACAARRAAFSLAGAVDPTEYFAPGGREGGENHMRGQDPEEEHRP